MQAFALRALIPQVRIKFRANLLAAEFDLQPTLISRRYSLRLKYELGLTPEVIVINPRLKKPSDKVALPHVYSGDQLCLNLPEEWFPEMLIAHTTVPWASEWLFYYEIWLATGDWLGGGEHPITLMS